ncbi:UDP-N-acetylmuramate dehydrogenase [Thalassotalea psychrophila]|uniref:UDP-N-acetylenolpyruvoylglucosamine reductase n=1 Tax=Thalassotalea psychrophila TaxID=3065647 RepID=A0ABY9TW05_9GAMM|nr:UDP-N-acetylmuramate dehydrogenase [Colwelliaceae bacterium SQ149]
MHHKNYPLKNLNSFALDVSAKDIVFAKTVEQVKEFAQNLPEQFYILGGGSNSLFVENYQGTIFCPDLRGINVNDEDNNFHIHVASGENWHELVQYCLSNNMAGLENLALIPGNCGAAPIQNIGAYGVEFANVCDYVDWFDFQSLKVVRLPAEHCQFSYRDSIFKNALKNKGVVIAIGLKLNKFWQPTLKYQGLNELGDTPSPQQVFDTVIAIRESKLPDPKVIPNAGSFFKNPIVDHQTFAAIKAQYPDFPAYPAKGSDMKLAAGWLIQESQLKGVSIGGAAVHKLQALVLINSNNATGKNVIELARHVQNTVKKIFNVALEPEVRLISAQGEQRIEDIN